MNAQTSVEPVTLEVPSFCQECPFAQVYQLIQHKLQNPGVDRLLIWFGKNNKGKPAVKTVAAYYNGKNQWRTRRKPLYGR